MNIVTDYTKNQLDRSSYVSEDRYKWALDLNRIRLATQKIIGLSNRYAYYYNEAMYKKLVAMIPSRYNINAGLGNLALIDNSRIIDTTNDEDQLRMAEETYGKETIKAIIDVVTGDDDLGDYDKSEDEIKQEAEEQADSDSTDGEIKIPPFDIPGKKNPITETTKKTGGKTVQETVEEITKTGTNPDGTTPKPTSPGHITITSTELIHDVGEREVTLTVNGDGTVTMSNGSGSTTITVTHVTDYPYLGNGQSIKGITDDGTRIVVWSDNPIIGHSNTPEDHRGDPPDSSGTRDSYTPPCDTPPCNEPPCDCDWTLDLLAPDCDSYTPPCDTPPCDTPPCNEPPCDCDCDCDCDTPPCDTPPCDTPPCNEPPCDEPPCNEPCDSGGCTNDCNDCCIGDGGCQSDSGCACDCCVNDCISCDCDCGGDCDNYGDCIDSCGGNE